ncbi:MAG: ferric reductase-like transmembrane domain-containing protein [Nanoarchaeota archaeon]|nr:ferric reductase-like transmembrane domain-containing protein [DPANN group archaeon]MBL7116211.1 ferric reductase-like transmembrane domain-containing protein [Nanoarchaeota archaeon]
MNNKLRIHFASVLVVFLVLLVGNIISTSFNQQILIYVSSFGFLAFLLVIFVLSIPLFVRLKKNNFTTSLLVNRRLIGVYTFFFALIHVFLVFNFIFSWDINKLIESPNRLFLVLGIISFFILFFLAVTSNNKSLRMLGKNWKKLHYLVYVVLILIIIHSFNVGLIFMKSTVIKTVILLLVILIVIGKIRYYELVKVNKIF